MRRRDLIIAPMCEGTLILIVGVAAWITRQPLIFASLGPTAYELVETPNRPSARPYNIIVGHLIGVGAGFGAMLAAHAWNSAAVSPGHVSLTRIAASVLAAIVTVFLTLLLRAAQPAAIATALLISLGILPRPEDALVIMAAVLLITAAGEPLRRWRAKHARTLETNLRD